MNYSYQIRTLILFVCVAFIVATQDSCRKSADVKPEITVQSPTTVDTVFEIDKVTGTYIATDTFISLKSMSPITFDTVYSTFEIVVSPKGTNMIQFDTVLNDDYKLSCHSYCLDNACTCYKYLTDVTRTSYDNVYYDYYVVNVAFEGDKFRYKTSNSREKQLRMGIAFKK